MIRTGEHTAGATGVDVGLGVTLDEEVTWMVLGRTEETWTEETRTEELTCKLELDGRLMRGTEEEETEKCGTTLVEEGRGLDVGEGRTGEAGNCGRASDEPTRATRIARAYILSSDSVA